MGMQRTHQGLWRVWAGFSIYFPGRNKPTLSNRWRGASSGSDSTISMQYPSGLGERERWGADGRTCVVFFFTIRVWAIPCGVETMPVAEKVKYSHTNWQPKGAGYDSWGELAVVVVLYVRTRGGIGLLSSGNFIHMWYPSSTQPLSHTHCGISAWKSAIKIQWIIVTLSLSRSSLLLFFCWFCQAVYLNKTNKWN